jgi:hypothetical protein
VIDSQEASFEGKIKLTDPKELHKVMELAVDISADSDWASYRLNV